jgi:flagellar protein FliO/FliZ
MADVGRIVLSLIAVAGACLATAWLARRSRGAVRGGLRIVSRAQVSKGSSLLVVSVGSRMLLVGAAEGNIRLISELDPADLEPADLEPADLEPAPAEEPALVPAALLPGTVMHALPAALTATTTTRSTDGPRTGLVRNLQRMTLRTAPEGSFRVRRR